LTTTFPWKVALPDPVRLIPTLGDELFPEITIDEPRALAKRTLFDPENLRSPIGTALLAIGVTVLTFTAFELKIALSAAVGFVNGFDELLQLGA